MVEIIMQVFGLGMVGIIMVCIVWTFGTYIVEDIKRKKL